jgi:hypothetical protein
MIITWVIAIILLSLTIITVSSFQGMINSLNTSFKITDLCPDYTTKKNAYLDN